MEEKIQVQLYLTLEKYSPDKMKTFKLVPGFPCLVADVMARLRMPSDEPVLIIVNGRQAFLETSLKPGDELRFFPLLAGG